MKSKRPSNKRQLSLIKLLGLGVGLAAAGFCAPSAHAVSGTWTGATDNTWGTAGNWDSGGVPGTGDTAGFTNSALLANNNTTIDLGAGQAAATVLFDTANAAAYTIGAGNAGSQTLTLDNTGAVTMTAAVGNNELFNANIVLGTGAVGTTTITNSTTAASGFSLTFAGTVLGGTGGTAGVKTLNTAGTGAINFTNSLNAGGSTQLNLADVGASTVTLSGNVTSNLNTLRSTGGNGSRVVVNGQTVNVAASSSFGGSSTLNGSFTLQSGGLAFNGGITMNNNTPDSSQFLVSGGTFSASTINLVRTQSFTALQTTAYTGTMYGFVVTGGTANVTGILSINGSNSSGTSFFAGGTTTIAGQVNVGNSASPNSGRWNQLQVSGGSFTNTDTTNGITLSPNASGGNLSEFLVGGTGTATVEKISFGLSTSATGTTTGVSQGALVINGAGSSLYVGSGGMVQGATANYTTTINLTAGTLGAKADWSSSLNMALNGTAGTSFTFKAADVNNTAHNINLTGIVSGTGGLTKTGAGTLTLSAANQYSGLTTVNAGTLNINGVNALGGANYAGLTLNGGTLQYATGATGNGSLDISNIGGTAKPVTFGASGATIDTNGNNVTFANTVGNSGAGSLTKAGTGILTLAAANTFTGGTLINAGTLAVSVNGGLGSGNTTVAGGTTLELGTGVTAAHSLNTTTLTLLGTNSVVQLDGPANTSQDTVFSLVVAGVTEPNGTYGAAGSGAATILPEFTGTGYLTVVPEPGTWASLLVGMAGLAAVVARRRRATA